MRNWQMMGITFAAAVMPSQLLSIAPPPPMPHQPLQAQCVIQTFVDALNEGDYDRVSSIKIFDDREGVVTKENQKDFFAALAQKTLKNPIEIKRLSYLKTDDVQPLYIAVLQTRNVDEYWSAWVFSFKSNALTSARRADELWPLVGEQMAFNAGPCAI